MVDTVVIKSETPPEDQAHIDAMVAKVDAAANAGQPDTDALGKENTSDRPGWLPEKFKSPEDLAKAYAELESKLGKGEAQKADPSEPAPSEPANNQEQVAEELSTKGLSLDDFSAEFAQKGELSAESYDKLEKAGYPRHLVDGYIEGQKALASKFEMEVKSSVGGDKAFNEMVSWATTNVSQSELEAYNQAVSSGDPEKAKLAVLGMYQKFSAARPSEPQLISGATKGGASDIYESMAQMKEDMKNPLYKNDPAFRQKVQAKLARSNIM